MSGVDINELIKSGALPSKVELPAQEGVGSNPNILDMNSGRLPLIIQLAQLGQTVRIRKALEEKGSTYQGELDPRFLAVTALHQVIRPTFPWISVYISNDGVNPVYIGINTQLKWIQMLAGETRTIDNTDAEKRIEEMWYWCDAGNTSALRVEGYY